MRRPRGRHLGHVAATCVIAAAMVLVAGATATAAHVNRTVGPYTILVVLIEEPFFTTNRAGFEFFVNDDAGRVAGLDTSLTAEAIGPSRHLPLAISPAGADGGYDVERHLDGRPFDPGTSGGWSLRLRGSIRGLVIDESFGLVFPSYPRVATGQAPSAPPVPSAPDRMNPLLPIGGLILAGLGVVRVVRGNRRRQVAPTTVAPALPVGQGPG